MATTIGQLTRDSSGSHDSLEAQAKLPGPGGRSSDHEPAAGWQYALTALPASLVSVSR